MLVSTLNEKVCEYFSFTDPEIKPVYESISQIYLYLISNCLHIYQNEVKEDPLSGELYSLRAINKQLEEKYKKELESGRSKDIIIEQCE